MVVLYRLVSLLLLLLQASINAATSSSSSCGTKQLEENPILCHMVQRSQNDENDLEALAKEMTEFAARQGHLVDLRIRSNKKELSPVRSETTTEVERRTLYEATALSQDHHKLIRGSNALVVREDGSQQLPVVMAHGMGDSCFNSGMQHITKKVSGLLGDGVYTVCIPIGSTQAEDTKNGYFLNMDASVDVFAEKIKKDLNLQGGFHAIGFSQGNNIIRGYIAKYNDPTVHTFISVNGVNAGIGAVPYCRPDRVAATRDDRLFSMCDLLMEEASRAAYTEYAQEHSFQANYWRDPRPSAAELYQKYSQLAVWNNEAGGAINETLRENWAKTQKFVWVLATEDGMVWPREGEHWGAPDPEDPFHHILPMKETEWYKNDLFGLKTAEEAGKNYYESFEGDHLAFTEEDFERWVLTYCK